MPTRPVVAIDVGGTFTDCVAWTEHGLRVAKLSTTADQSEGVIAGASSLVGDRAASSLLHGSTVATNALLEGSGADTLLITDAGFEDVIEIGRQDRPSLYDSFADRAIPLVARKDRWGWEGAAASEVAGRVRDRAPQSVAVSLAYSFADPAGELALGEAVSRLGLPVSLSHQVVGEFREFERTSTTVLNAYLGPVVARYLAGLAAGAGAVADRLAIMRSSGGLMDVGAAADLAVALLLSGPAGGVVAAAELGRAAGYERVIAFDMGGTSTDVCRIEGGRPEVVYERSIEGYPCRMPSVGVDTVGAGGGSIAWVDRGGSLRVGPRSAGSHPGPAAYGRGGTAATVTDAHVVLGRLASTTPLGGELALDPRAASAAVAEVGRSLTLDVEQTAAGIMQVVEAHMERAIRGVSVEQGADPRRATLVAYGGAGGLHATGLARRLGVKRVVIPPMAGVFSALGLLMAPPRVDVARSVLITADGADDLGLEVDRMAGSAEAGFTTSHGRPATTTTRLVDMRYVGQSHEITVPVGTGGSFDEAEAAFHRAHREINGFSRPDDPVEVVTVRTVASGLPALRWSDLPALEPGDMPTPGRRSVVFEGRRLPTDVWWRPDLPSGGRIEGPAVIEDEVGTTVLAPEERAEIVADGSIVIAL